MSIEAMKLALEALEYFSDTATLNMDKAFSEDAITALRQAIEQAQKQERTGSCPLEDCDGGPETHGCWAHNCEWKAQKQEPVARKKHEPTIDLDKYAGTYGGYTSPPQRQWVGLTDEEYTEMWGKKPDLLNFFRKIEAKLKEKNT